MTVVGVVADVKEDRFNFRIDRPAWYLPYAQQTAAPAALSLVVRASGDPLATGSAVRTAIRSINRQQSVSSMTTMTNHVADVLVTERFTAVLMTMLASVGLLLAAFGLYSVVAYSSMQRTVELGCHGARREERRCDAGWRSARSPAVALALGVRLAARVRPASCLRDLYGIDADDPMLPR